jgi:uracil permease
VGLIIGAVAAGLVYVVIAVIVKLVGVKWITRLMPAVVIGPTVSIIGLSLAGNAVGDILTGGKPETNVYAALFCGLMCLFVTIQCSVYGKKIGKLIPFIFGIMAGYLFSFILTFIAELSGMEELVVLDFTPFANLVDNGVTIHTFFQVPDFTFIKAFGGFDGVSAGYIGTVLAAYIPVAFVVFAEHIADHKNISSIIEKDLLVDPGLHRTLLGDGVGSMAGAFFGGCPNTTYGESVGCVAITGNASVITILATAILAIAASFFAPFVTFLSTIPSCVMGGVCVTLYGFIAVSGLKMLQPVDLNDNRNLFTASVILIAGIGGMALKIGSVTITEVACALILGIIVNLLFNRPAKDEQ